MALTVVVAADSPSNKMRTAVDAETVEVLCEVTADSSYPTGGYPLDTVALALFDDQALSVTDIQSQVDLTGAFNVALDFTNQTIMYFTGGAQVADTTDIATVVIRMRLYTKRVLS